MNIILAIIVFGIIIAVHEFGHFIVAKLCDIRVNKFAIGMGPAIFKKQRGETEYSLRLLPIGGYCSMEGEDESSDDARGFGNKKVSRRMAVVVAGAVMNILLGFVLLIVSTAIGDGISSTTISRFHYNETGASVATSETCGLQVDDKIVEINGMHIFTATDIAYKLQYTDSDTFTLVVRRDDEMVTLENVKFYDTATEGRLDFYVYPQEKTVWNVVSYAALDTVSTARIIWMSLFDMLTGKYGFHDLSGPVGIVGAIGDAATMGENILEHILSLMSLMTMITINVGIFNLLPLPALDGGRLIFLIVEAFRGKPVKPEHEGLVHFIGLAILLLLMVAVTFNDIVNLVS